MSRDHIQDPAEDSAFSLRRIEDHLSEIVDRLDRIAKVLEAQLPSGSPGLTVREPTGPISREDVEDFYNGVPPAGRSAL